MGLDAGRLHLGEVIAGGGAILLLVALFVLPWYSVHPAAPATSASVSLDGWNSLSTGRWILVVTSIVAIALVLVTAMRRSPAVPVAFSVFTSVIGAIACVLVLYRIVDPPTLGIGQTTQAGIYVALAGALAVAYGGYRSMRTEVSPFSDLASIETVRLTGTESTADLGTAPGSEPGPIGP